MTVQLPVDSTYLESTKANHKLEHGLAFQINEVC